MKFISVESFFLVWALPVLFLICFLGIRKRQNILLRFSSLKGLKSIVPESSITRRWIKAGLILLAVLFAIVALSGPQYGYKWQKIERKGIDIIIALDCSKSMLAKDIKPDRLERAKREVYDLLSMLHGDRVALVAFAGTSFLQCPLTLDYAVFNLFLDVLSPDFLPVGGTDIYGAVITSLSGFNKDDNSEKAVILITDGQSTGIDPIEAAKAADKADVKIFCIGIGSAAGVPVPDKKGGFKKDEKGNIVLTKLDENTLKKMAAITGGAYVRSVAGDMDLDVLYLQEIRGKMKASALESDKKQVWENRYQWPLAFAIIALIAELFLPSRKKMIQLAVFMLIFVHVPLSFASGIHDSMKQGLEAYDNKNYEKALKFFIDAQLEDPDRPEILYNIGNAYYKMGDADSAYHHYKQIVKTENKNLLQKTYYNLGNANFKRGKLKDAVSDYKSALDINPDDTQARENMEFAKKVMEEQKKQQEQKESQNQESDKKPNEKPGEKSGENQNQKQENKDKNKEKQQDGSNDKTNADENNGKSGQNNNMPDTAGNKENKESSKGTAKPDDKTGDNADDEQADRMLNRLTDRPGRAMIPAYRERRVEKDW